ncbi:MAG TPA: serine/threonine protein kinase [Candidatus Omnitrophota bacterium]|nr:serine/threonine protein kinase [Candidatus Omnitrophota bacterium]HPS21122.1 serine/threonine protein kinase [Candidatus Omnitrophota bacterium]
MENQDQTPHFASLTHETVIKIAEEELEKPFSGLCRPYKSYINRIFELADMDKNGFVIKFYRPGRWSKSALQDEHDFLLELAEAEIPVIPPLRLKGSKTIGASDDIMFAIFPKKSGRLSDEFSEDEWLELGRLIARVHNVGAIHSPKDRITLTPDKVTRDHVSFMLKHNLIPKELAGQFTRTTEELFDLIAPLFENKPLIRIHGDCYSANIINRPGESLYLIDFDDMAVGPAVHDIWMLLPGYVKDSRRELNLFIEGYEAFRDFNMNDLKLIEPLRAMRYIHFIAWCAHQVADHGFSNLAPGWGSAQYWQTEIKDLAEQIERIKKEL